MVRVQGVGYSSEDEYFGFSFFSSYEQIYETKRYRRGDVPARRNPRGPLRRRRRRRRRRVRQGLRRDRRLFGGDVGDGVRRRSPKRDGCVTADVSAERGQVRAGVDVRRERDQSAGTPLSHWSIRIGPFMLVHSCWSTHTPHASKAASFT